MKINNTIVPKTYCLIFNNTVQVFFQIQTEFYREAATVQSVYLLKYCKRYASLTEGEIDVTINSNPYAIDRMVFMMNKKENATRQKVISTMEILLETCNMLFDAEGRLLGGGINRNTTSD